ARATLQALDGVASVVADPQRANKVLLRARPREGQAILEKIAGAVRSGQIPAIEVYQNRGDLDEAFRLITTGAAVKAA
ncbi:MAG: hypothetical protein KDE14_16415, partial [Rhodobacteraceae bacterium]|nr:hypothetical protein [Paracoccaceae bacterium]